MVANKSIAQLIDVTLMPLHECIERIAPARQARLYELGIGLIGDRHLIAGLGVLGTGPCARKHRVIWLDRAAGAKVKRKSAW